MLYLGNYVTKVRYIQSIILERITTIRKVHSNISSNNIVLNLLNKTSSSGLFFRGNKITSKKEKVILDGLRVREGMSGCLVFLLGSLQVISLKTSV